MNVWALLAVGCERHFAAAYKIVLLLLVLLLILVASASITPL